MELISDTSLLQAFCEHAARQPYVTLDTEFIRVDTYWPQVCLIQMATPEQNCLIDPLASSLNLDPFFDLLQNPNVTKVLHSARQDMEIFWNLRKVIPAPLFDTQIAAMACGFGDSVGYEVLVNKISKKTLDKSMRLTDWSQRPLSPKQLQYALSDVTHLCGIYEHLQQKLVRLGRLNWLDEEMKLLSSPTTYEPQPEEVWKRLKHRSYNPKYLAVVQRVAKVREEEAIRQNRARSRILKDEVLLEVAAHAPATTRDLIKIRGVSDGMERSNFGKEIIQAIAEAKALSPEQLPSVPQRIELTSLQSSALELLKVLLKIRSDHLRIAPKLLATTPDLETIACAPLESIATLECLQGWRWEVWGEDVKRLLSGEYALTFGKQGVKLIPLPKPE